MTAAVVGLGKIGLPIAVQFATSGVKTIGCDIEPSVVELVNQGVPPFPGEAGLAEALPGLISSGALVATTDTTAAVSEVDVVVVLVPLVVDEDRNPSFDAIDAATRDIGRGLKHGQLVVYETTVPVGSTRGRFGPILEEESGLIPGQDFRLAYSPERVFSGRILTDLSRYPKIVGGIDEGSSREAASFYESVLTFEPRPDLSRDNGVWEVGSTEEAEFVKLAETTYRDVNIGLANEFARYAEHIGIDVAPIIEAANSQPFSHIHQPGLVGGHCIPVYPYFYLDGDPDARLPRTARQVNESVGTRVVARVDDRLGDLQGATVAVLGATYRGGVKETAFSGVFPLVQEIGARGGRALVHDPLLTEDELRQVGLEPFKLGSRCDAAIVQTDHDMYRTLTPDAVPGCQVIVDIRRVLNEEQWFGVVDVVTLGSGQRGFAITREAPPG